MGKNIQLDETLYTSEINQACFEEPSLYLRPSEDKMSFCASVMAAAFTTAALSGRSRPLPPAASDASSEIGGVSPRND